jgi:hypothetical protein
MYFHAGERAKTCTGGPLAQSEARKRLAQIMDARRLELGLTWQDVAEQGDVSLRALSNARAGDNEIRALTRAGIEKGLRWPQGTVTVILAGGEPAPHREHLPAMQRLERHGAPFPAQLLELLDLENTAYYRELKARVEVAATAHGVDLSDPAARLDGEWVFPGGDEDSITARAQWDFYASGDATPLGEVMTPWQIVAALAVPVAVAQPDVRARLLGESGTTGGCSAAGLAGPPLGARAQWRLPGALHGLRPPR